MIEFMFSYGSAFGGIYKLTLERNKIKVEWECFGEVSDKFRTYDVPANFDNGIKAIVKDWKPEYELDSMVIDNIEWNIKCKFDDGSIVESEGFNAKPDNFVFLYNYMEPFIKELREETKDDYIKKVNAYMENLIPNSSK